MSRKHFRSGVFSSASFKVVKTSLRRIVNKYNSVIYPTLENVLVLLGFALKLADFLRQLLELTLEFRERRLDLCAVGHRDTENQE
jgi:hypothetical protein